MGKIVKLGFDADSYLESARRKYDDGRLIDAIADYHTVIEYDPENKTAYIEMAHAYEDIGCDDAAEKTFMKMIGADRKWDEGYIGMMVHCLLNGDDRMAKYYLDQGKKYGAFDDSDEVDDYTEMVNEAGRIADEHAYKEGRGGFSLVKDGTDETLFLAQALLFGGEYDFAQTVFEGVDKDSKYYDQARMGLIHVLYMQGKYDECIVRCDDLLKKNPESMPLLIEKMLACYDSGRFDEAYEVGDRLDALDLKSKRDVQALAVAFMQAQDDDYAAKYHEKMLEFLPYDRDSLLVIAQAEYNLGMRAEAREDAMVLRKLYPEDPAVAFYARHIVLGDVKEFTLSYDIPEEELEKREKRVSAKIRRLGTIDAVEKELDKDARFLEEVKCLLREKHNPVGTEVAKFLCRSGKWRPYIRSLLLDTSISVGTKCSMIEAYLNYSDDKSYEVGTGNAVLFFDPVVPAPVGTKEEEAIYWYVVANLTFRARDFSGPIAKSYEKLISAMHEKNVPKFSRQVIAGVMLYEAGLEQFPTVDRCLEVFNTSPGRMRSLIRKAGLSDDDRTKREKEQTPAKKGE